MSRLTTHNQTWGSVHWNDTPLCECVCLNSLVHPWCGNTCTDLPHRIKLEAVYTGMIGPCVHPCGSVCVRALSCPPLMWHYWLTTQNQTWGSVHWNDKPLCPPLRECVCLSSLVHPWCGNTDLPHRIKLEAVYTGMIGPCVHPCGSVCVFEQSCPPLMWYYWLTTQDQTWGSVRWNDRPLCPPLRECVCWSSLAHPWCGTSECVRYTGSKIPVKVCSYNQASLTWISTTCKFQKVAI